MIERILRLAIVPANLLSTMANFNLDAEVYAGSQPYSITPLGQEQDFSTILLINSHQSLNRIRVIHLDIFLNAYHLSPGIVVRYQRHGCCTCFK